MKRKRLIYFSCGAFFIVMTAYFSMGLLNNTQQKGSGTWQTSVATRRDIGSFVLATGIIKPRVGAEVRVGSRVSGIVKRLHVKVGDRITKGQLLGELDRTEFQARYHQALAALANAKAELIYATLNLKRHLALRKKDFTPQDKVDEAEMNHALAQSKVKQAEANLDYARIQLGYTWIRAPIPGVVASVSTQEGETVAASLAAPTFVVIIDLERLEVWAYVDETDIGRIEENQSATFTVDTYPGIDFAGEVTSIYPKAEMKDNVVNYVATIDITGKEGFILRPEMTTTVKIFQETRPKVVTVPRDAVKREAGKQWIYVVKGKQLQKRWVEVGWADGSYIEITRGLEAGESIITGKNEEATK